MLSFKWLLKGFLSGSTPTSPIGRCIRIEKLVNETKKERDVCALIVYGRDLERGYKLDDEENKDWMRVVVRLRRGDIKLEEFNKI